MTKITEAEWLAELEKATAEQNRIPELGPGWWFSTDFIRETGISRGRYYAMIRAADAAGKLERKEAFRLGVHGRAVRICAYRIKR